MAENGSGVIEQIKEEVGDGKLSSSLAGKEFVLPAVMSVAGAVAAAKGPELLRGLGGSVEGKGQAEIAELGRKAADGAKERLAGGGLAGKMLSKAFGGGNGGGGGKKTRRLPIQRWTDVAVPVEQAYEAWIKFDQYPKFMHRVLSVEREGRDKVRWEEKIWFSRRRWEGQITERRKNDRIAWKTTSGMSHKGIVSFHKLGDNLTRVMVEMEFEPNGMIEKMASGMRFVKRAVQSDLARFKAYVEFKDAKGIDFRDGDQGQSDSNGTQSRSSSSSGSISSRRQERRQGRAQRRSGSGNRSRSSR
jgi:uncharacterized membrane protein